MTSTATATRHSIPRAAGRVLGANSPVLLVLMTIAVLIVILTSFILSFPSLVELAVLANIDEEIAWGWPLVVDGTIIVATFGTLLLSVRSNKITRAYPWIVLIVFGALSIYANGIHAVGGTITDTEAFIVGAVAPLALLTSTHLLVIMLHSPMPDETDEDRVKTAKREAARAASQRPAAVQPPTAAPAALPASTRAPSSPVEPEGDGDREAAIARTIAHFEEHGEWPTGPTVAAWFGKSDRTGARLIAAARSRHEIDAQFESMSAARS